MSENEINETNSNELLNDIGVNNNPENSDNILDIKFDLGENSLDRMDKTAKNNIESSEGENIEVKNTQLEISEDFENNLDIGKTYKIQDIKKNNSDLNYIPNDSEGYIPNDSEGQVGMLEVVYPSMKVKTGVVKKMEPNLNLLMDVQMTLTVELGRTKMFIKEILGLGEGSIIELDKLAGEPVDLLVNGKLVAKGEVVVIDENFGVRVTDIVSPLERVKIESKEAS